MTIRVSTSYDCRNRGDCWVLGQIVLFDKRIETAAFAQMRVFNTWNIIRSCTGLLRNRHDLVRRDEQELRPFVDEPCDQPETGDPVDDRTLTGTPWSARGDDLIARKRLAVSAR